MAAGLVQIAVRQPITVAVGVVLAILAGVVAFTRVPVQLAPDVESVVVNIETRWENAAPFEVESDIVEEQEEVLANLEGLTSMISTCRRGEGEIRLEFRTGTDIASAVAQVDQKLAEVPFYPDGVGQPRVRGVDPQSIDYIAWIGLSCSDTSYDALTLGDFMERRLKPRLERIPGIAEVQVRGAVESEVRVVVDEVALAQRGITWSQLVAVLRANNANASGGTLDDGKHQVRLLVPGRFRDPAEVEDLVLSRSPEGVVLLRDVARVESAPKELRGWVRARGVRAPFMNFQLSKGANLIETMEELKSEVAKLNESGGFLARKAEREGIDGTLKLVQVYDATLYVDQAIDLVQQNILVGGALAVISLLLFLRSLASVGIIALAIPISVVSSVVVLSMFGRSINVISLAGLAFSVGLVVDNAIVVLENIFRHLEEGEEPRVAAREGAREVAGAVLASTLTTLVVFLPVLLIEQTAGQLFRDIAIAIMSAVALSLVVSLSVIPSAAALLLRRKGKRREPGRIGRIVTAPARFLAAVPGAVGRGVVAINRRFWLRYPLILAMASGTVVGIALLVPPLDYLPRGNRNLVFGLMITPPGYSLDKLGEVGDRVEDRMRPFWEATPDKFAAEEESRQAAVEEDRRVAVPAPRPDGSGEGPPPTVVPPPLENYFLVSVGGMMFHGAVSAEPERAADMMHLFAHATAPELTPDIFAFSFQAPLFRTGGTSGAAISVDLTGLDLDRISSSGGALFGALMGAFQGQAKIRPSPSNFSVRTPQLTIHPDDHRLRELGMTRTDLGHALQAGGDGIRLVKVFEDESQLKDLRIISNQALGERALDELATFPVATPDGEIVDFGAIAKPDRERVADEIRRVDRERAVTLELTPPTGVPLQDAIVRVEGTVAQMREAGVIPPDVDVSLSGSAGNLAEIRTALMGDGSVVGTIASTLFLALLVVYLLMVVLFQSWLQPLVIMVTVPLATLGGFLGLRLVHDWSLGDPYFPVQNMDVLTILGFVILAGIVVNNAILIVVQTNNFLAKRRGEDRDDPIADAIRDATASRVRPIFMSMTTSIGGMLPLVLTPGAGSELYRGLGAVVVGGLAVSTVFTLVLVPMLLDTALRLRRAATPDRQSGPP